MARKRKPSASGMRLSPGTFFALPRLLATRLPKNNPQAGAQRLGVYFERAHWGEGTPEISMASEYATRVSGGFRQAGNNVALSRAPLSVGTLRQGSRAGPPLF